ncbi:DsbA family protein [Segnochrobactrum spirostomi]|nr:DsbA family protein [Segnochrobactrum spirostomi]
MTPTRRSLSAVFGAVALAASLAFAAPAALAQDGPTSVDVAELMKPTALGDRVLGKADAPVTIVEYASMTCPHCAAFHAETWPALKTQYIDTGKARFIFREFPLDPLAAAASMLARCAPEDKYYDMIDLFFDHQREWAYTDKPLDALQNMAKQAGFTQMSFEACLTNQKLLDGINAEKDQALSKFGVNSTPTFFVNGQKLVGEQTIESMGKAITDAAAKASK